MTDSNKVTALAKILEVGAFLKSLTKDGFNLKELQDSISEQELQSLAVLMRDLGNAKDDIKSALTEINKLYDHVRIVAIPEKMDGEGINTVSYAGIGRVSLTSDAYCTVKKDDVPEQHKWLIERGDDDLIGQTVNASSFKAYCNAVVKDGGELPEFVNFTPFTRASITQR